MKATTVLSLVFAAGGALAATAGAPALLPVAPLYAGDEEACGENDGKVCKETELCTTYTTNPFQCLGWTKEYFYYPSSGGGGGDDQ